MALSGVTTLTVTKDQIITAAFEDMGIYAPGFETPSAQEVSSASLRLNMMIKAWQAAGVGLWLYQEIFLPFQASTKNYALGPSGTHCTASLGQTTTSVAAVSGASTITVTTVTGIVNGMFIGVELDGGSIQWTTVNGAPVGSVVTLAAVLTGAVAAGNAVYFYSTKTARPISIVEARVRTSSSVDTDLTVMSRNEYDSLSLKTATGKPTSYYYDPQMTNGVFYPWPLATEMSDIILMTGRIPIQVFVNLSDNPHFPEEWFDALHYSLALRLCAAYKVPPAQEAAIKQMAIVTLQDARDFDREQEVSLFFSPAFR